ncbi:MAG: cyclophilin-like fold protein [Thermodesulfovibrio sp.]|nr:cyclophilin-like fold protein [Thermodesulfovibrio sp.]MCX7723796.1 cyclophilin-like fold protein [Thermodesulfovibrio sp.]MDW7972801.1 cyclophilin-like fold protein [Thermodesulfovibrio sp.]
MPEKINIIIDGKKLKAELFDTQCGRKIYQALPIESTINEWGDEFYFSIGIKMPLDETATTKVKVGDIGYWPPGEALAIFFGKTPLSTGEDPIPASEVNIVGRLIDDPLILKTLKGARKIKIEKE